jgi:hypothetical protein
MVEGVGGRRRSPVEVVIGGARRVRLLDGSVSRKRVFSAKGGALEMDVIPSVVIDTTSFREDGITKLGISARYLNGRREEIMTRSSHDLFQCYRAMKILARLPDIEPETLHACLCAANPKPFPSDQQHFFPVLRRSLGWGRFKRLRQEVLEFVPSTKEVEQMLGRATEVGVPVLSFGHEILSGRVNPSDTLVNLMESQADLFAQVQLGRSGALSD